MKIGIATDHNGVNEKLVIIDYLKEEGYEILDLSTDNNPTDDYPIFANRLSKSLINKEINIGILMCGTGIGMSIAANKVKGIRCAKVSNTNEAKLAKLHNNANVLALSYKENMNNLIDIIDTFIKTEFSNEERHIRRINLIKDIENEN